MTDESRQTEPTDIRNTIEQGPDRPQPGNLQSETNTTTIVYALQAASFLLLITFLIAIIVNYVKKDDVKGTWLESHFRWQIRTFWYSLLWSVVGAITYIIFIGYYVFIANAIWIIYRIAKGWMRLIEKKPMYI